MSLPGLELPRYTLQFLILQLATVSGWVSPLDVIFT